MNVVKRFFLSIGSSVDSFAEKVENQEAVAEGIIREMEEAVISVRSELIKMRNERIRLEKAVTKQTEDKSQWSERAKRVVQQDRDKAIQCMKFIKECENRITEMNEELLEVRRAEGELQANLSESEKRLNELRRKKRVLASRQTRAEATNSVRSVRGSLNGEAEELFSRWEARVGRVEGIPEEHSSEAELMAMEFASTEEEEELNSMLDSLLEEEEK